MALLCCSLREPQGKSTQSLQHAILFRLLLKRGYNIIDFDINLPIAPKLGRECFKMLEKTISRLSKIFLKPDCSVELRLLDTQMNLFTFNQLKKKNCLPVLNERVRVGTAAEVYIGMNGMTIGHCPPLSE